VVTCFYFHLETTEIIKLQTLKEATVDQLFSEIVQQTDVLLGKFSKIPLI